MKKTSLVIGVVGVLLGVAVVANGIVLGQQALWERPAAKPAEPAPSLGHATHGVSGGVPSAAKPTEPGPALDLPEPPSGVKVTSFKSPPVSPPVASPARMSPLKVSAPEPVLPARLVPTEPATPSQFAPTEPVMPARFVPPEPAAPSRSAPTEPVMPARFVPPETAPSDIPSQPAGRQEPAVSVEWIGPPIVRLHQAVPFQLVVKNTSTFPVEQTIVRQRVPAGVTVKLT